MRNAPLSASWLCVHTCDDVAQKPVYGNRQPDRNVACCAIFVWIQCCWKMYLYGNFICGLNSTYWHMWNSAGKRGWNLRSETRNVLKRAGAESSLKRSRFFPLCCLWMCFSQITWGSMETFEHSDIVDNSCLTHSHSYPTFEQCCQQTWYEAFCLVTEGKTCSVIAHRHICSIRSRLIAC